MRWVTREYVRTEQARRRSVWHRWFAWHPVVVRVEEEFDHWVWLETLERKWTVGRYRNHGHWRYRHPGAHPEQFDAEDYGEAVEYFGKQMSQETGMPLQECIGRIAEDLKAGRVRIDFDEKNDCFRLVPVPPDRGGHEARRESRGFTKTIRRGAITLPPSRRNY